MNNIIDKRVLMKNIAKNVHDYFWNKGIKYDIKKDNYEIIMRKKWFALLFYKWFFDDNNIIYKSPIGYYYNCENISLIIYDGKSKDGYLNYVDLENLDKVYFWILKIKEDLLDKKTFISYESIIYKGNEKELECLHNLYHKIKGEKNKNNKAKYGLSLIESDSNTGNLSLTEEKHGRGKCKKVFHEIGINNHGYAKIDRRF
jgi:hypothetical protein